MNTITLGGYTNEKGERKGGNEYTVKATYTASGEGSPISLIIGEPKSEIKSRSRKSSFKPITKSRLDTNVKDTLALAVSKDEKRPHLQHVHTDGNGMEIATDGFRIHLQYGKAQPCKVCKAEGHNFPDVNYVIPKSSKISVKIDAAELKSAFLRAGIFAREGSNVSKVRLNGHAEITGSSEELGTATTDLEYAGIVSKVIDEITFGINWQYARDAINHVAPNGGEVTISVQSKVSPVTFESADKQRMAVVMPMNLG